MYFAPDKAEQGGPARVASANGLTQWDIFSSFTATKINLQLTDNGQNFLSQPGKVVCSLVAAKLVEESYWV